MNAVITEQYVQQAPVRALPALPRRDVHVQFAKQRAEPKNSNSPTTHKPVNETNDWTNDEKLFCVVCVSFFHDYDIHANILLWI